MKIDISNSNPEKWIEEELSILKNIPARSEANIKKGREKFESEKKSLQKSVTFSRDNRLLNKGIKLFPINFSARPVASLVMALLITVVMLLGSISSVVYASQGALPDEALYPVKLLQESVQLSLARDPQERVNLNIAFTNRRLDEIVQLQTKGRLLSQSILDRLSQQIDQTLLAIDGLDQPEQKVEALLNLQKNVEKHQEQLQKIEDRANPRAAAERTRLGAILKTRLDLLEQGIRDPQELHRIMMQQKEEIKEETKEAPGQIKKSDAADSENNGTDKATSAAEDKKDKEKEEKEKVTPETKNTHAIKATPEPVSTEALSTPQSNKEKNNNGTTGSNSNSANTNNNNNSGSNNSSSSSNNGNNSNNSNSSTNNGNSSNSNNSANNNGNSGNSSNNGNSSNENNGNGNGNNGNSNNGNNGNGNINTE